MRPQAELRDSVEYRHFVVPLVPLVMVLLSGCGDADQGLGADLEIGLDASGSARTSVDLPFSTTFTQRWNARNDGTDYEPCVALDSAGLDRLSIDPTSVRDAAGTDGQTLRGCQWSYELSGPQRWAVSQFVGNSESLAAYKAKYSHERWMTDRVIEYRAVGVSDSPDLGECMTYVQSGGAGVITLVIHHGLPHPPVREVCDRAIAFTAATIGKMPL